jgi:hypothetical protein
MSGAIVLYTLCFLTAFTGLFAFGWLCGSWSKMGLPMRCAVIAFGAIGLLDLLLSAYNLLAAH